jgi:hypothetical protein
VFVHPDDRLAQHVHRGLPGVPARARVSAPDRESPRRSHTGEERVGCRQTAPRSCLRASSVSKSLCSSVPSPVSPEHTHGRLPALLAVPHDLEVVALAHHAEHDPADARPAPRSAAISPGLVPAGYRQSGGALPSRYSTTIGYERSLIRARCGGSVRGSPQTSVKERRRRARTRSGSSGSMGAEPAS